MLVKQGLLHYNGYIRKGGPSRGMQRRNRILQEESVEERISDRTRLRRAV